jgi:hypothetical protein
VENARNTQAEVEELKSKHARFRESLRNSEQAMV